MKTLFRFTLTLLISFYSFAQAGERGNGGGVHYCSGPATAEFYDLYEGREVYGMNIQSNSYQSIDRIVESKVTKVALQYGELAIELREKLDYFKTNMRVTTNKRIIAIEDADKVMVDRGCQYEQLANWHEMSGLIFVDSFYLRKLKTNTDVAAFYIHEALYKIARESLEAKNSNKVRKLVAEIFSDQKLSTTIAAPEQTYSLRYKVETLTKRELDSIKASSRVTDTEDLLSENTGPWRNAQCMSGARLKLTLLEQESFGLVTIDLRAGERHESVRLNRGERIDINLSDIASGPKDNSHWVVIDLDYFTYPFVIGGKIYPVFNISVESPLCGNYSFSKRMGMAGQQRSKDHFLNNLYWINL